MVFFILIQILVKHSVSKRFAVSDLAYVSNKKTLCLYGLSSFLPFTTIAVFVIFFISYFSFGITSIQYMYHDLSVTIYPTLAQYFIKNENQHNRRDRSGTVYT